MELDNSENELQQSHPKKLLKLKHKKVPSASRNMEELKNKKEKQKTSIVDEDNLINAGHPDVKYTVRQKRRKVLDDSQEVEPVETKTDTKATRMTEEVNPILYRHSKRSSKQNSNISPHFGGAPVQEISRQTQPQNNDIEQRQRNEKEVEQKEIEDFGFINEIADR